MEPVITIQGLTVHYGTFCAVDNFTLDVGNETVVLFGPSGCGKTTVLKAILGVSDRNMHVQGSITLKGASTCNQSGEIGMVFQGPVIPTWIKVKDLCRIGHRVSALDPETQKRKIQETLTRFQIAELADHYPYQLSGGQKQRVALAVALVNEPKALLLDEPSTFIDGMTRFAIWNFLETQIRPLRIPTIIVSHDPTEALRLGDRILLLGSNAHVRECINIPFAHPRDHVVEENEEYWRLHGRIVSSEAE